MRTGFALLLVSALVCLPAALMSASAQPAAIAMEELWRIGDEKDEVLFGHLAQVSADGDGRIYVADSQEPVIRVFSDTGMLITTVGGPGEGPGELTRVRNVVVGQDGQVYVWDYRSDRLSAFEWREGNLEFNSSYLIRDYDGRYPIDLAGVGADGPVFVFHRPIGLCYECLSDAGIPPVEVRLVNAEGVIVGKPVLTLPSDEYLIAGNSKSMVWLRMPFGKEHHVTMSPNGELHSGWSEAIEIRVQSVGGTLVRTVNHAHDPVPVTKNELDAFMTGLPRELRGALRDTGPQRSRPAYTNLVVDDQDRIWIQLSAATHAATAPCLILNPDGSAVAIVELPIALELEAIRGGRAYGNIEDPDSGPLVVAYQIRE